MTEFNEGSDRKELGDGSSGININKEIQDAIRYIISEKEVLEAKKESIKESVEAVAKKMNISVKQLNGIIGTIIKENKEGGVLADKEEEVDLTREIFEKMEIIPSERRKKERKKKDDKA